MLAERGPARSVLRRYRNVKGAGETPALRNTAPHFAVCVTLEFGSIVSASNSVVRIRLLGITAQILNVRGEMTFC